MLINTLKTTAAMIATAALAVTIASASAHAQPANPVQSYKAIAKAAIDECQIQVNDNLAAVQWRLAQTAKPGECIADSKPRIKDAFEAAAKTIKKPDARAALKDHLAGTFSALDGLLPQTSEPTPAYEARQRARESRLTDLWARVEIAL